ncbi:hypothetical protein CO2235_MP60181 [Cupriavidus oxalaticus]|uniref:Uncharacterized protein n=1 Tax=Cupriavidus oxalaticus TaxID=96344 RepID=A0A375GPB4_9BURK|nr:hypothetical protein CO2235_MP60181 [Cupriavidus oxalaticus]
MVYSSRPSRWSIWWGQRSCRRRWAVLSKSKEHCWAAGWRPDFVEAPALTPGPSPAGGRGEQTGPQDLQGLKSDTFRLGQTCRPLPRLHSPPGNAPDSQQ